MSIVQAIILGIVQAVTEFLPISSSAHLTIIPWLFNLGETSGIFDIALHFGTLLAIGLFFFKDWVELIKAGFGNVVGKKTKTGNMFWYIVLATIPGGIIGFILDKYTENFFRTQYLIIGIALILMGIVIYIVDKNAKSIVKYEDLSLKQTLIIGVSQALAFIPGVSRSGVTITTGRFLGLDRESAARFSFLLSAPIILAAFIFKIKDLSLTSEILIPFIVGILTSFVVGMFVIKFLLAYLKKGSFKVFSIYRFVVGVIVIAAYFIN